MELHSVRGRELYYSKEMQTWIGEDQKTGKALQDTYSLSMGLLFPE